MSLPVDPALAPSSINPGELVSILVTNDGTTHLVADRLLVISYGGDGDAFGSNINVLRVAVRDGQNASEIALAAEIGAVSIIGVTGANEVAIPQSVTGFGGSETP